MGLRVYAVNVAAALATFVGTAVAVEVDGRATGPVELLRKIPELEPSLERVTYRGLTPGMGTSYFGSGDPLFTGSFMDEFNPAKVGLEKSQLAENRAVEVWKKKKIRDPDTTCLTALQEGANRINALLDKHAARSKAQFQAYLGELQRCPKVRDPESGPVPDPKCNTALRADYRGKTRAMAEPFLKDEAAPAFHQYKEQVLACIARLDAVAVASREETVRLGERYDYLGAMLRSQEWPPVVKLLDVRNLLLDRVASLSAAKGWE